MIRVGVIGVGALGKHHARIYSELHEVELVGVVDIHSGRASEVAAAHGCSAFTDYRELFGKVDAISLAAPTEEHARIGQECLSRNVDVLVEKPIAATVEDARKLIDAAEKHGRILQVGHVERYNPVVEAATRIATEPQFFEVHRLSKFSMRSLDIDVVLDLMIHDIDVILSLVDSEVFEIRAAGIPVLSTKSDIANVRIEFANGTVANMTASRVSTAPSRKLRFFQPHDYVSLDYAAQKGYRLSLRAGQLSHLDLAPPFSEPLRVELEAFIDAIVTRSTPRVDGQAALKALEVALTVNLEIERHRQRRAGAVAQSESRVPD